MELLLIRGAAVLIAAAISAYTDYKTGLIPDKITYSLIALGAVLLIFDFNFQAVLISGAVFAIGYVFYYAGKFGGGDVKLFTGIALVLPVLGGQVFVITVLFAASAFAAVWMGAYYAIKYFRGGGGFNENRKRIILACALGIVVSALLALSAWGGRISLFAAMAMGVPLLFALLFVALERGIRRTCFLERVNIGALDEDDIIAIEFMGEGQAEKLGTMFRAGLKGIIDEKAKRGLEKLGIKEVPVYRNLPRFGPFILAGVIIALLMPDLLFLIVPVGGTAYALG
ncbi:MAG: A24 family peptidase [Candidatus Diapherotrites archaeon]|nr:A24 family peptidase [Candidatus Micrarchaeota archaeon]